jgi:hypothetical protein
MRRPVPKAFPETLDDLLPRVRKGTAPKGVAPPQLAGNAEVKRIWSPQQLLEHVNFAELLLARHADTRQVRKAMSEKFGPISYHHARKVIKRVYARWERDHDPSDPATLHADRQAARRTVVRYIQELDEEIAKARREGRQGVVARLADTRLRHEERLACLEGTNQPLAVDMHHQVDVRVSGAVIGAIASLTSDQRIELLQEQRLADRLLLEHNARDADGSAQ